MTGSRLTRWAAGPHDRVLMLGIALWVVAQGLPAYSQPTSSGEVTYPGGAATLLAWLLGLVSFPVLVAATANLWFVVALFLRAARRRVAVVLAAMAFACSSLGMVILLAGGLPESGEYSAVTFVGLGSWLWWAGMGLVFAATARWTIVLRSRARGLDPGRAASATSGSPHADGPLAGRPRRPAATVASGLVGLVAVVLVAWSTGIGSVRTAWTPVPPDPGWVEMWSDPCDFICLATLDLPDRTIAVGMGWDDGAPMSEGYLAAYMVRNGTVTKTRLVAADRGDPEVGGADLVPWGDGAAIVAGGLGAGASLYVWMTSDGLVWTGPMTGSLPGESPIVRQVARWRSHLLALGEQLTAGDRYLASIWASIDGATWKLLPRPSEWDDEGVSRWWEGGDGLVMAVADGHAEHLWTTADLVHWREIGTPQPCAWRQAEGSWETQCLPPTTAAPSD